MSEHKPLIPSRVAFGHGSVHQEPPGEGQHDFRPPAEPIADGCTAQRCTKCGELASEAPEFCEGAPGQLYLVAESSEAAKLFISRLDCFTAMCFDYLDAARRCRDQVLPSRKIYHLSLEETQ